MGILSLKPIRTHFSVRTEPSSAGIQFIKIAFYAVAITACRPTSEPLHVAHEPSCPTSAPPALLTRSAPSDPSALRLSPVEEPEEAPNAVAAVMNLRRAFNPLHTVAVLGEQTPKRGYHGIPLRRAGPFPGVPFAEVRAYAYHFDGKYRLNDAVPGCRPGEDGLLAKDGTLCPSVVLPAAYLTRLQVERLVDLFRHPDQETVHVHCGGDPHHAFVFYDASGLPVAEITVDLSCGMWWARPLPAGTVPSMYANEKPMRQLCRELDLGGCSIGDDQLEEKIHAVLEHRRSIHRTDASLYEWVKSGIDRNASLRTLSALDRRKLCAEILDTRFRLFTRPGAGSRGGYDCPGGPAMDLLPLAECGARVPWCDAPVARVMGCEEAFVKDVCFERADTYLACEGVAACLPDVAWKRLPARLPAAKE